MRFKWTILSVGLVLIVGIASCTSPTTAPTIAPTAAAVVQATVAIPTTAPTVVPTVPPTAPPTLAPSPTPAPTSDNCIKCHTNKETLEKLAEKKVDKSEATSGEG